MEDRVVGSFLRLMMCLVVGMMMLSACEEQTEHTAPAINDRDSVSTMITNGVNTLISDSGLIKYRIVAERWEINQRRNPQRWIFDKGLFISCISNAIRLIISMVLDCGNSVDVFMY